jgi:hypothetical protein
VRGGFRAALQACDGAKAVAEGAVLEARPAEGQEGRPSAAAASGPGSTVVLRRCEGAGSSSAAMSTDPWSTLVLRHCELRAPQVAADSGGAHSSMLSQEGGRGTAANCTCEGPAVSMGQGSSLLLVGLAFAPGLADTVVTLDGGVARELPAAGGAAGPRAEAVPPAAPA